MRRVLMAGLIGLGLVASGCATGPSGPQTYTVAVDASSPEGENLQYSTYFPATLKVRPGDSVTFENGSSQAPHTITFGIAGDRANQPAIVLPDGSENPAVLMPCSTDDDPTPELTECPDEDLGPYAGEGYWNSGYLVPAAAPEGPKEATLTLADSIESGTYRYVCILHGPMAGVIEVVEEDGERETPEDVTTEGSEELEALRDRAAGIPDPEVAEEDGAAVVAAGWSEGVVAANRFFPDDVEVETGTTVRWSAFSDFEPHTVSFGPDVQAGNPESASFTPSGAASGRNYTGGPSNSGIFGREDGQIFPPGPFELTFTQAGEYRYVCILHPAMEGVVRVT